MKRVLPLVLKWPDPRLKQVADPWEFGDDQATGQLCVDLTESMLGGKGVGLSAPQIGVNKRVFCIATNPVEVFFNPTVVWFSDNEDAQEESCMSAPGASALVKRPKDITIRYHKPDGTVDTRTFRGVTSRIVQHEMDHLDGIMFWDRAHPMHRERALKNMKLFARKLKKEKKTSD